MSPGERPTRSPWFAQSQRMQFHHQQVCGVGFCTQTHTTDRQGDTTATSIPAASPGFPGGDPARAVSARHPVMIFQGRAEADTGHRATYRAPTHTLGPDTLSGLSILSGPSPWGQNPTLTYSANLPTGPRRPSLEGQTFTTGLRPGQAPAAQPPSLLFNQNLTDNTDPTDMACLTTGSQEGLSRAQS